MFVFCIFFWDGIGNKRGTDLGNYLKSSVFFRARVLIREIVLVPLVRIKGINLTESKFSRIQLLASAYLYGKVAVKSWVLFSNKLW